MDPTKSNIDFFDKNNKSTNTKIFEITNPKTDYDGNENNEVIKSNFQCSENIVSSDTDITEKNKIVVLDYNNAGSIINHNYLFNNLKPKTICLYKINISYEEIVKTFKEKLISKIIDGKYIMNNKDAINLDKMIGLACIAMNESEKNNKQLKTRNAILNTKCANYDRVVKECNRLKSELDKIVINLSLALGRRVNDKEDIIHLTNVSAALFARDSEYHYIQMENDRLKYSLNKQLMDIRVKTLNNYDEILNSIDLFTEELYIKNLKISQLMDDLCSVKAENEEKNGIIQLLKDKSSKYSNEYVDKNLDDRLDCSQYDNELYEGKLLISEQINQLVESRNIEAESYQLSDLINILIKTILDKEEILENINKQNTQKIKEQNQQLMKELDDNKDWQKYLEKDIEKLNSQIENYEHVIEMLKVKENVQNNFKENYTKIQLMYDELYRDDVHLKILIDKYKHQLSEKEIKCIDNDILIKTLQLSLTEQANKLEQAHCMYKNENKNFQKIEIHNQQMIEKYRAQIREKNIDIASLQNKCFNLKDQISSAEAEINNLKQNITILNHKLNKKNKIIQEISNKQVTHSLEFNDQLHTMSKIEEQSIINDEEYVLSKHMNMKSFTQSKTDNNWIAKHKNIKKINHQNVMNDKEIILLDHQMKIKRLEKYYNLNIANLTDTQDSLKKEIQNLEESLKLKSAQIILVEKIANSQLKEAFNMIQYLNQTTTSQHVDLNRMKKGYNTNTVLISDKGNSKHLSDTINKGFQQMESTQDLFVKLIRKNKTMKKLCQIRKEKIKHLENCITPQAYNTK